MTIETIIDYYCLDCKVIQKDNNSHYMLIAYDKQHLMLLDIKHPKIIKVVLDWFEEGKVSYSKEYKFLNKYIYPVEIEVQQNTSNIILLEHDFYDGCDDPNCNGGCPKCTLSICKVCGGYEGSLTTDCPNEDYREKWDDVHKGKLDFRYGKWREEICTRVMLWSSDKAIPNEIKYLQELLSENVPDNILKEECNYILQCIDVEKGLILR